MDYMELNISKLQTYFKSTGAKDHPYFWINGAENIVPNLLACVNLVGYEPTITSIETFTNPMEDKLRGLFEKYGSDKFIHAYYKLYSHMLASRTGLDILEIGIGTKNPALPSTMYFYKEACDFDSTPGGSLRAFRDFVPGSTVYGADIDRDCLFEEDRIMTAHVDQLDPESLDALFQGKTFDFIVVDGLHHITADLNSVMALIKRMNAGGTLIVEDIVILDTWKIVDCVLSRLDGYTTSLVKDDHKYMYVLKKMGDQVIHDGLCAHHL